MTAKIKHAIMTRLSCRLAGRVRHVAAFAGNNYKVCTLPGDGIGPEIMEVSKELLTIAGNKEGVQFEMTDHLIGGAGIDEFDDPYPALTEHACKSSDAVLLAAIGGCVSEQAVSSA
jgi:isocitrate/isopropylmalate dehydrogenase